MFVSRTAGERFPRDESRGPQLRQGLQLFRVVNGTGLQIREGIDLDSEPCGRVHPGEVFGVNDTAVIRHKKRRLNRLHVVQPRCGWVSGIEKWMECFSGDDLRPGPIPLRSTLNETCPALMKHDQEGGSSRLEVSTLEGCGLASGNRCEARLSLRSRWLHYKGEAWPAAPPKTPGPPQYSPRVTLTTENADGVGFSKEKRFLSTTVRCITTGHERQALSLFSPGPRYVGHDDVQQILPPSSAPAGCRRSTRPTRNRSENRRRAATTKRLRLGNRRLHSRTKDSGVPSGPGFISLEARETAEKHLGRATAGSRGAPVMRLPVSDKNDSGRCCFVPKIGAESPGPAHHVPNHSCISSTGCPVFATPRGSEPESEARSKQRSGARINYSCTGSARWSKSLQELRRWPEFTHYRHERVTGNLGSDSPGPGLVNVADHDPFRPVSFLKRDVCHPPPAYSTNSSGQLWRGHSLRRA